MVYFLVLTSVIVHGITIPIGKGFNHARTLTLTFSTGAPTNNLVSRLPAPVPFGGENVQVEIEVPPESTAQDSSSEDGDDKSKREHVKIQIPIPEAVHFDVDTPDNKHHHNATASISRNNSGNFTPGVQWSDVVHNGRRSGPPSGTATPVRASTPVLAEHVVEHPIGIIKRTGKVGHDSPV